MKKTAVMIGAGNIGRGFIGAAFAASGYEVVFVDVDERLIDEINARGEYPVRILHPDGKYTEHVVHGVRAVSGKDTGAVAACIAHAEICATAVGVRALQLIVPQLALGLALRSRNEGPPLNIIVCENLIDAGSVLREYVSDIIPKGLESAIDELAGYPQAVIGRMVPPQTEEMKDGDPLRVCVEEYGFIPVDKAAFKGEIPKIEGMVPLDRFEYYEKRKLFIHNLGHAAAAYLGLLKGYTYISEAANDGDILYMTLNAMRESAAALNCEYPENAENLSRNINSLLYRFSNKALPDTCARVAVDPIRKLGENDRIIGALLNCENYGLPAVYIAAIAAAAALMLEKSYVGKGNLPKLTDITGLSADSNAYKMIMNFGTTCVSAIVHGDDAVASLRGVAMKYAGDINIL